MYAHQVTRITDCGVEAVPEEFSFSAADFLMKYQPLKGV